VSAEITPQPAPMTQWLSIIGVGEDGIAGLTSFARERVSSAKYVFGGERHLALVAPIIRGSAQRWSSPFDSTFAEVLSHRGEAVCVLATGDPMHHGAGSSLSQLVSADEAVVVPSVSAFTLAASKLLWSVADATLISLCGPPVQTLRPHLHPGARVLVLSAGSRTPSEVAVALSELGFGPTRMTVLEALGGHQERIRKTTAAEFDLVDVAPLNTVALEVAAGPTAAVIPLSTGLPDRYFEHDGQITKREVRTLTVSALAPKRGELLWDVGAGAGSIAIEWLLSDPSLTAIAIECRSDRAERIRRNARALGVPKLRLVEGRAPAVLDALPRPDAVFLGGGVSTPGMIETIQKVLAGGGRIVANAVSLESEACLLRWRKALGGELTRIAISRADRLGEDEPRNVTGWRPLMPITQWCWTKP
jgi:precorrin-6B C5,15-methyltransferase / cobalt-precorrin-6B C5,C15-methyltransferase